MAGRKKKKLPDDFDFDRELGRLNNCISHAITQYEGYKEIGPIAALEAAKRCADLAIRLHELRDKASGKENTQTVNHVINGFSIEDLDIGHNGKPSN